MPRTARGERRQTSRHRLQIPDVTGQYLAAGKPKTLTVADAKRAAKKHFESGPRSNKGAYRCWVRITAKKRALRRDLTDVVMLQVHRTGDVEVVGTTTIRG